MFARRNPVVPWGEGETAFKRQLPQSRPGLPARPAVGPSAAPGPTAAPGQAGSLRPGLCLPEARTLPERQGPHCTQLFSWMPLWTTAKGNITAWPAARGLLGAAARASEQPRQTRSQRRRDFRLCFKLTAAFHRGLSGPRFQTGGGCSPFVSNAASYLQHCCRRTLATQAPTAGPLCWAGPRPHRPSLPLARVGPQSTAPGRQGHSNQRGQGAAGGNCFPLRAATVLSAQTCIVSFWTKTSPQPGRQKNKSSFLSRKHTGAVGGSTPVHTEPCLGSYHEPYHPAPAGSGPRKAWRQVWTPTAATGSSCQGERKRASQRSHRRLGCLCLLTLCPTPKES